MVTYIKSDLEFILEQIKLAEAHAAGQPLYGPGGLVPSYNLAWGLRTVDGTYNNLLPGRSEYGASDNPFRTLLGTEYRTIMVDPDGPGGMGPMPVSYQPGVDNDGPGSAGPGDVFDPYVRTISNLIVDQGLGNPAAILTGLQRGGLVAPEDEMTVLGTITAAYEAIEAEFLAVSQSQVAYFNLATTAAANPGDPIAQQAAADALVVLNSAIAALSAVRGPLDALLDANGIVLEGDNIQITNVAPDEGLSAPFNSWFTLFGQFFDHGLDLVAKGGAGTVFIPLMPDDPLYVPGGDTNFMVLTRATLDENGNAVNTTTAFVDQNQTYASHASHQVFLREYEFNGDGDPVNTGRLIEGSNGGMATWADMKEQARDMLGIWLRDDDVGNIPLLATDEYGNFIPGENGFPQIVFPGANPGDPPVLIEGNPAANGGLGVSVEFAVKTGHAFLADIAHSAVPGGVEDGDITIGLDNGDNTATDGFYDNELLDAHFMAGDGRANENIGLTAVHHVFHSEHNRLVEHTKEVVLADAQAILADTGSQAQAVAFLNEWLVEDVSTVPGGPGSLDWDGARLFQAAKFGTEMQYQHLVFEEFARKIQPSINAFLVPDGYDVTIDPSIVAEFAHVVYRFGHSMLTESIDRFDPSMTSDQISLIEGFLNPLEFQNNGGGSTVDANIAAGAIIRGMTRQEGNQIDEFVTSALRNNLLGLPLDLATINLARGRDTGVPSLNEARRDFYEASQQNILLKPYESWTDFASHLKNEASIINFIAAYGDHALIAAETTIDGKRDAALTIITGVSVGGMIVPADRLDFLNATGAYAGGTLGGLELVDLWIGGLAEETMPFGGMLGSTFNFVFEVQMEQLQSGDRFYYLQRLDGLHLFGEMEANSFASLIMRNTDATHLPSDVFSTPGLILEVNQAAQFNDLNGDGILESADPLGSGLLTQLVSRDNPSTVGADSNYLRYTGGDHIVMGGTNAADTMIAGIGDDTLHGDGGADRMDGGFGNDIINGGAGDDIVVDSGGDDNIKGGDGNDVIHAGPGLDLVLAGRGQDFVVLGTDEGSEVFAGEGNDFILGNRNAERVLGNEGNDWIETGTFDGAPGDNFDEIFAHDGIDGHDVFIGDGGFDEFIGEGGDDIMVGSQGRGKMVGMSGFDWATYKDNIAGVNADLSIPIVFDESPTLPENAALEEFEGIEGLSGSQHDDILRGNDEGAIGMLPTSQGGSGGYQGSVLDAEGIARIEGLQALLGAGVTSISAGDIILGGAGSDLIEGQGGDDIIDGDSWLNVRIAVHANIGPDGGTGAVLEYADSMTDLMSRMFSGQLNPGQLNIARQIVTEDGVGDTDVAAFSGVRADYDISQNGDGSYSIVHARGTQADGEDRLINIEMLQFADVTLSLTGMFTPVVSDTTPTEGDAISAAFVEILDPDGTLNPVLTYQWQRLDGATWVDIAGATGSDFVPTQAEVGHMLRTVVNYSDDNGLTWENVTAATGITGDLYIGNAAGNVYNGAAGDDNVFGMGGNDFLNGGLGSDRTTGGLGNDFHYVENASDIVFEAVGEGTADRVLAAASYVLTAGAEIELLSTTNNTGTGAINLTGNELANTVLGNDGVNILNGGGGNDTLLGRAGNDTLNGGDGSDMIHGDAGSDTVDGGQGDDFLYGDAGIDTTIGGAGNDFHYVDDALDLVVESSGQGTDRVLASLTYALATGVEVEMLSTSSNTGSGAINLTGNELANTVVGNDGVNTLWGGGGNDTLIGRNGNDTLWGGAANDVINGDDGSDMAYGEAGSDTLNGGQGNDFLDGGAGVDTTIGGAGNDFHYVDNAMDIVSEAAGGGTTDRVLASTNYVLAANVEVELISTTNNVGTTAINLSGNNLANTVLGNDGANILNGGGGNDALVGRAGDDTLNGDAGVDNLLGDAGADTLNGGAGNDRLDGGAGSDILEWHVGGGRDFVNGGANIDTFELTGDASAETYRIYSRTEALAAGITGLDAATEIVITRNGTNTASVVAELDNIEEIVITGMGGGDTFIPIGTFAGTSLMTSTITLNGSDADDTVDISALTSAHRVVFRANGGDDTVIGDLRPDDVIEGGGISTMQYGAAVPVAELFETFRGALRETGGDGVYLRPGSDSGFSRSQSGEPAGASTASVLEPDDFIVGRDLLTAFDRPQLGSAMTEWARMDPLLLKNDLFETRWWDTAPHLNEDDFGLRGFEPDSIL